MVFWAQDEFSTVYQEQGDRVQACWACIVQEVREETDPESPAGSGLAVPPSEGERLGLRCFPGLQILKSKLIAAAQIYEEWEA